MAAAVLPVPATETEDTNKKGPMPLWLVAGLGGISGLAFGTILGFILSSQYANYKDVVCDIPGHENGGHHGDEETSWYHDGPTYETFASTADKMWLLGSVAGGVVAGIVIAVLIALYMRNKAEKPTASAVTFAAPVATAGQQQITGSSQSRNSLPSGV